MQHLGRTVTLVGALVLLTSTGCGASMSSLVDEGRWVDACVEASEGHVDEWAPKQRYLLGEVARTTDAEVAVHVFDQEELAEFLPYVPARMASGEVVLVAGELHYGGGEAEALALQPTPNGESGTGLPFACCEPDQWMDLDGRAEEWEQMEQARRVAEEQMRERRERYSGPLGFWRAMGELALGLSADIVFIGTLGVLDVDLSDLPGATGAPLQWAQAVAARVRENLAEGGEHSAPDELTLARAESLVILTNLMTPSPICWAARGETCSTMQLYELRGDAVVTAVTATVAGHFVGAEGDCRSGSEATEEVGDRGERRSLSTIYPPVPPP